MGEIDITARNFLFALFSMMEKEKVHYKAGVYAIICMMDMKRINRMESRSADRNLQ